MLTKIIYKNFRSNFKNYVAFFIGNMMGVYTHNMDKYTT